MAKIAVVNIRAKDFDSKQLLAIRLDLGPILYIGRANKTYNLRASIWANPHRIEDIQQERDCTALKARTMSVGRYEYDLLHNVALLQQLHTLRQYQALACWCAPESCHGHVLVKYAMMDDDHIDGLIRKVKMQNGND
jgi:hypothetical protein